MLDGFFTMLKMVLEFALFCAKWACIALAPLILSFIFYRLYWRCKGVKKPVSETPREKEHNTPLPVKILRDFPRQWTLDYLNKDPDSFSYNGIHIFCGEQGSGKTISAFEFSRRIKREYPRAIMKSNTDCTFADKTISDINDVISSTNGIYGEITFIDEIQNWFASNESKNFPPEMLSEVCQQRKQRKILIATSQVFTRLAKPIREQCTYLYLPLTIAGCFTIVRVYKPKLDSDADVKKLRPIKTYCFVHDDELRNCYDTYKKIERLVQGGFKARTETIFGERESGKDETAKPLAAVRPPLALKKKE